MLKEFKPALLFVTKFLIIYFIGNVIYGLYVESFGEKPDVLTEWVTEQSVQILNTTGQSTEVYCDEQAPKVHIVTENRAVISVYEGCNGVNVFVIFIAFVIAYGGNYKNLLWFIPLGLVGVHVANLLRIVMLYFVAEYFPNYMYFTHKFLFTGFIYAFVLALWYGWVIIWSKK